MTAATLPATSGIDAHLRGVVHLYPTPDGEVVALRGVDLDVHGGEVVALLGPSGAGKSTVLAVLAGLLRPSAGEVRIGERVLASLSAPELDELRATDVSFVPQEPQRGLLPYATVRDNVRFAQRGAVARGARPPWTPGELLEAVGLDGLAQHRVGTLPGGQQKQVALTAGIAVSPRLLLIDEPTSQLDPAGRDRVMATLRDLNRLTGLTVVLVTHDPAVASTIERTVTIRDGRIGAEGREGTDFAVIGADGSLHLPPEALELLPPGTLVRVTRDEEAVQLHAADISPVRPGAQRG